MKPITRLHNLTRQEAELRASRDATIRLAYREGQKVEQIAAATGLTVGRVYQIIRGH